MKWLARGALALLVVYGSWFAVVLGAMTRTPDQFGQFMRHVPAALVWAPLPAKRMWLWARQGSLREGDVAPDFTLPTLDHTSHVSLSSLRGRPVVLVFGSYT